MSALGRAVRRLGHTRWFAACTPLLVPADRLVARLTRGRVVALGLVPSLLITTTGRRSGRPRSTPLLYVPDGDALIVAGSNWGRPEQPAWALNLLADPTATVTVDGTRTPVRARMAEGAERDRLWALLVAEWPAYRTYVHRAGVREIRVFRLEPAGPPAGEWPPGTTGDNDLDIRGANGAG
ncbi:nitroreductase/quinone reductase family protein [Plantactinospora sp. WMMC1484]|uniref:nitroreductase/quinone reductase family protein n=1 Tax=Plantactinospora sp. WMMC1484 TaxID=3404122 RepID=UPI003BF5E499